MSPVGRRKLIKHHELVAIFGQRLDRLRVFVLVGVDEVVEGSLRLLLGLGHIDVVDQRLGPRPGRTLCELVSYT